MPFHRVLLLLLPLAALMILLPTRCASSLFRHNTSPLFTNSFQVHSLTAQNYDKMLRDNKTVWLIDYYAPWCPHCRQFAPEWDIIAHFYAQSDIVKVGAVDCTKYNAICNQENIYGYPGVKLHHVPADAEKAWLMPHVIKTSKSVTEWAERLMMDHGLKSGVDLEDLAAYVPTYRNNSVVGVDQDEGQMVYNDHLLDIKYKRLLDASSAMVSTFEDGLFMGADVLEGERYDAALMWIKALAATFPIETNRQVLSTLVNAMNENDRWNQADWNVLVNRWKERTSAKTFPTNLFATSEDKSWSLCTTYTCGLWILFHICTVTEVNATIASSASEPWRPSKMMAAVRLYVKNFFGCEECREHFLELNPESVIDDLAMRDAEGSHAVIMWLWKMHNTVNMVVKKEQWPSKRACPICYVENGEPISLDLVRLHENEIVAYVKSAYGYDDEEIYAMNVALNGTVVVLWSSMESFTAMMMGLGLIALFGVAYKTRKSRMFDRKTYMTRDHIA